MGIARDRGQLAERLVASYFELIGGEIVARNVRLNDVEVDLIVRERTTQVLVEVKCRTRSDYGGAALAVDERKRSRLARAALALQRGGADPVRVDVVAVELSPDGASLRHYRNVVWD